MSRAELWRQGGGYNVSLPEIDTLVDIALETEVDEVFDDAVSDAQRFGRGADHSHRFGSEQCIQHGLLLG